MRNLHPNLHLYSKQRFLQSLFTRTNACAGITRSPLVYCIPHDHKVSTRLLYSTWPQGLHWFIVFHMTTRSPLVYCIPHDHKVSTGLLYSTWLLLFSNAFECHLISVQSPPSFLSFFYPISSSSYLRASRIVFKTTCHGIMNFFNSKDKLKNPLAFLLNVNLKYKKIKFKVAKLFLWTL